MEQQIITNGGLQHVPQIAVQYVYLDFDGELTSYNGEIVTVDNVEVQDSSLTEERIANIVAELNAKYAAQNVIFVTERPGTAEYSTIYIGKTSAFEQYGNFTGLAETIDKGNQISTDNAFVMLDSTADNAQILSTISHETCHLLGTLDHGGTGLNAYAANTIIGAGTTSTGLTITYGNSVTISSGGTANRTTVNSGGEMYISSDGTANSTTVNAGGYMYIRSGGTATNIIWTPCIGYVGVANGAHVTYTSSYSGVYFGSDNQLLSHAESMTGKTVSGSMYVMSGGIVNSITVDYWGHMDISNGGVANSTTVNSGYMRISSGGTANSTTVNDWGSMDICGVGNNTTVNSGRMQISSGGTANSTTVNSGSMYISSGGTANSTTVNSGSMHISSGGVANSTTVNSEGSMCILSGGVASGTTVCEGGTLYVSSGGSAVNVSGEFFLNYGGVYNGKIYSAPAIILPSTSQTFIVNMVCDGTPNNHDLYYFDTVNAVITSGLNYLSDRYHISTTISSGAVLTTLEPDDSVTIFESAVVSSGGSMITNNAIITGLQIHRGGKVHVNGGICNIFDGWGYEKPHYVSYGIASDVDIQGTFTLGNQASLFNAEIKNGGIAYILANAEAEKITVATSGNLYIAMGGNAENITISGGSVHVATGGRISNVSVVDKGTVFLYGGSVIDGNVNVQGTIKLDDLAVNNGNVNFVLGKNSNKAMVNDLSLLSGGTYSINVENALQGEYIIAENASGFDGTITVQNSSGNLGSLNVGKSISANGCTYSLNKNGNALIFGAVVNSTVSGVAATASGVTWDAITIATEYIINCSKDNFAHQLTVKSATNALDTFGMPSAAYQYQVSVNGKNWSTPAKTDVTAATVPQKLISDKDSDMDLFFAKANGTWEDGFEAEHQGIYNNWIGTREHIALEGKNKIADVFTGSTDANVLVLTDDVNGDALFVDDVYTAFGKDAARLSQINEIRAGLGDDIVDLTSQKFAYAGDGVKIYGGLGNDTIWANNGENTLFGDAGNDRIVGGSGDDVIIGGIGNDSMHGGGGSDIFCFGEDWGSDTVEQLSGGSVTLWFAEGSAGNWNAATLTYTDGANSVKVSGISDVTLKFGTDTALPAGCFDDAASEKIFEDKDKGMLA